MKSVKTKSVLIVILICLAFSLVYFFTYNYFALGFFNTLDFIKNYIIAFIAICSILAIYFKKYLALFVFFFCIIFILLAPSLVRPWQNREKDLIKQKVTMLAEEIDDYNAKNKQYPSSLVVLNGLKQNLNYFLGVQEKKLVYKQDRAAYTISFVYYGGTLHVYNSINKEWRIEE